MKRIVLLLVVFVLAGCTYRGVYEGIQTGKRNECATVPQSDYDECMENSSISYDEYQDELQKTTEQ